MGSKKSSFSEADTNIRMENFDRKESFLFDLNDDFLTMYDLSTEYMKYLDKLRGLFPDGNDMTSDEVMKCAYQDLSEKQNLWREQNSKVVTLEEKLQELIVENEQLRTVTRVDCHAP